MSSFFTIINVVSLLQGNLELLTGIFIHSSPIKHHFGVVVQNFEKVNASSQAQIFKIVDIEIETTWFVELVDDHPRLLARGVGNSNLIDAQVVGL